MTAGVYSIGTQRSISDTEEFCDQHGIFLDLWRKTIHQCDADESLRHQDSLEKISVTGMKSHGLIIVRMQ